MLHHSLPPTTISHHHISKYNIFHIQPQSTSHTIPHPQLFHTTPTFNITAHFTPHHIPHRITLQSVSHHHFKAKHIPRHTATVHISHHSTSTSTSTTIPHPQNISPLTILHITLHQHILITPPHLTSQHIASFSTSDISQQSHRTLHMPHSSSHYSTPHFTSHHDFPHLALCNIPHFAFHITPCLKLQLMTFHIAPHLRSLHHISAHHSTTGPHSTAHHAMHIATVKYKSHIPLSHSSFQTTAHIPHCISTIIPHHTMSNMASNHSTSVFHNHISHLASQHTTIFPMHHTIVPHRITTFHASPDIA